MGGRRWAQQADERAADEPVLEERSAWPKGLPIPMCGDKEEDRAELWRSTPQVKSNKQTRKETKEEGRFCGVKSRAHRGRAELRR